MEYLKAPKFWHPQKVDFLALYGFYLIDDQQHFNIELLAAMQSSQEKLLYW